MNIKFAKNNLSVNQIVLQKTEKFIVVEDEIVPDIKPDILSIISTSGNVCIQKKEVQDGKIKIDGTIEGYVVYIANDEKSNIRAINTTMPFSKIIEIPEITSSMVVCEKAVIQNIECKALNERKINLKASIEVNFMVYSKEEVEYIENIEDTKNVETLSKSLNVNALVGCGDTKVYAKDTVSIESTDNLVDIMKVNVSVENIENKVSYNKILTKADGVFKIMYLTDEGRIETKQAVIPIIGFLDMQNVEEDNLCDISFELKNLEVRPNNMEEHSVYVEAEFEILGIIYKKQNINIIEDLYGRQEILNYNKKEVKIMATRESVIQKYSLKKQEKIDELGNNKIYDMQVKCVILKENVENNRITYQGNNEITFIYEKNNGMGLGTKTLAEPFEFTIESDLIKSKSSIQTSVKIIQKDAVVMSADLVDIKLEQEFCANICTEENIKVIENIKEDETRSIEKFSIVIYYAKSNDNLWKIAKRFGSTVDEITKINNLENEAKILPGEQLFIPR